MCTDFLEREEQKIKVRWKNERAEGKQARQRVERVKRKVEDRERENHVGFLITQATKGYPQKSLRDVACKYRISFYQV